MRELLQSRQNFIVPFDFSEKLIKLLVKLMRQFAQVELLFKFRLGRELILIEPSKFLFINCEIDKEKHFSPSNYVYFK